MVRKGEIACYTESHNIFHSYIYLVHQNEALCGKELTVYHTIPTLMKKALENIVGKGASAGTSISSFSHSIFYSVKERNHHFSNS